MPVRTCVSCRGRFEKADLLRWTVDDQGQAVPDPGARQEGRGAYVCRKEECVVRLGKRLRKRGANAEHTVAAFHLAIQGDVPQNVADETHEF